MNHELIDFSERKLREAMEDFIASKGLKAWKDLRVAMMRLQQTHAVVGNTDSFARRSDDLDDIIDKAVLRAVDSTAPSWVALVNMFDNEISEDLP